MKTTNKKHFRQGDVGLCVSSEPELALVPAAPRGGRLILADGEATGHCHSVSVLEFPGAALFEAGVTFHEKWREKK
jgi:hypothetical protein